MLGSDLLRAQPALPPACPTAWGGPAQPSVPPDPSGCKAELCLAPVFATHTEPFPEGFCEGEIRFQVSAPEILWVMLL